MKLSFSVFAPMAGIAIVVTASANILALIPQVSATLSNYETKSSTLPVLAAITPVPVHHASSMTETIRSPVPLLLSRHPAVGSTGAAFEEFPQDGAAAAMLAVNMNSEQKAKAAIEADGYKDVRVLHRGSRNVWTAQALRGETYVTVSVDLSGNVSAN